MTEQQIRALSFWSGPVEITTLDGGITNRNYIVECNNQKYVARACQDLLYLGIDRRNEIACQNIAARLGLAPAVVHHENDVIISDFVAGRTLSAEDVRDGERLPRIARALRQLHNSADRLEGVLLYFFPFQAVRTYAATAREIGARLPEDIDEVIEDARKLEHDLAPFKPTLCHNDMLAANIIDAGERLWFVDWEYAGVGHPLFDLAGLSGNCALDDEQERALLRAYQGDSTHPEDMDPEDIEQQRRELRTLKIASLLREALWSFIQTEKSGLDFDYHKYASDNLEAYRIARAEIG